MTADVKRTRNRDSASPGGLDKALAMAVLTAAIPLLDVMLRIGITSPEAESLMRSLYVHRTRAWLASQPNAEAPTAARVALVSGVHRSFIREILETSPSIPPARGRRAYLPGRAISAWRTDPLYADQGGRPRDIPEKGPAPSFEALVAKYLPSHASADVLDELIRGKAVESIAEHRLRLRARSARRFGLNPEAIEAYAKSAKAVLEALTSQLLDPGSSVYAEFMPEVSIAQARLPLIREVIARRAGSLLRGLELEIGVEGKHRQGRGVPISVAVVALEGPPSPRRRRRSEKKNT